MLLRFLPQTFVCLALACMGLVAGEICALQPATPLARLSRQSWSMENGLPQNTVPVLMQSQNGYLWAGTESGLARFDGVSFKIYDHATAPSFPDAEIRCLLEDFNASSKDGIRENLWFGTGDGLVRWSNGRPVVLTTRDGLPSNSIRGLAQTSDGQVWVWTEAGLARWSGQRFEAAAGENDLPGSGITSIAADAVGGLWVATSREAAVFHQGHWHPGPEGSAHPTLVASLTGGDVLIAAGEGVFLAHHGDLTIVLAKSSLPDGDVGFLTRLADGTVAVASKSTLVLAQTGSRGRIEMRFAVAQQLPGFRIESMYADREGSLWVGTNRGLARITMQDGKASVRLLPPTDPLAANSIISLLEDREGDVWVGTETAGLHILRDARFRILGASDGLSSDSTTAIVQDIRETLWIGTRDSGLNRISAAKDATPAIAGLTTDQGLLSNFILAMAAAPNGDVWVGTPDGLNRIRGKTIDSFTSADGLPDDFIRSLLVAPDNSIWIGTRRGLTHYDRGRFQTLTQSDGLGSDLVGALIRTTDGDLWIATLNGVSRMHEGQLHNYTTADGLSSNVITALDVTGDGMIWIGTQGDGLNLWNGQRFIAIHGSPGGVVNAVSDALPAVIHAILHDDRGHLWLATNSGLTRIDTSALLDCAQHQKCELDANQFTTADGLRSRETSSNSHPTAWRTSDGHLWFATPRGVIEIDPLHFAAEPVSPPVDIERFAVDDQEQNTGQNTVGNSSALTRVSAGHLRFQFDYTGLSFAAPQKLRYQYMLEGFDHAWIEAGTRRTAYYTNIPHGSYRFRVRATLGDAASLSPSEADLSFELLPHYYQTVWFWVLMILAGAALLLLIFRRRVRRVEREFRAVMAERNRIAREIHDTLAQGYVGISLQLEILGELLRHNRSDAAANHLAITQELVREGLHDARQSIWALRSHDTGEQTLPIRLRRLVEKAQDRTLHAGLGVHGAFRALSPDVEQEILRIAQEAIHNVKRHARASRMDVRLDYDELEIALTVSDNGRGFEVSSESRPSRSQKAVRAAGATEGHYGLTGMQERAELIHAEIEIASEPGNGTTVRLNIPVPEAAAGASALDDAGLQRSEPETTATSSTKTGKEYQ